MNDPEIQWLEQSGRSLAFRHRKGRRPTILFLPGYMSDMEGAKAQAIDGFARSRGLACVRFDYSGTGASPGSFDEGTLDIWLQDSLAAVDSVGEGPLILAGSSMGGWLALHLALQRPQRVKAIVGIAAAPDFTDWGFGEADRQRLIAEGRIEDRDEDGSSSRLFTRDFWESGQRLRLLAEEIAIDCPVRLVHGEEDADVPVSIANRLVGRLRSADVQLTIVKGGGHRLSQPHEIAAILHALAGLVEPTS
jgi:pimeloyl-ACP methyl ester carboxylesterase